MTGRASSTEAGDGRPEQREGNFVSKPNAGCGVIGVSFSAIREHSIARITRSITRLKRA